jgi:hypothetical protein
MSTPGPSHWTPLALPRIVLDFIRDRYVAGVANAEVQYQNAAGDEDSLTGALGALISPSGPRHFWIGPATQIEVQIDFRKLRGRGHNAPEKRFGPDGIFQLQISTNGVPSFRKGLPFQAKKNWKGRNRQLANQARAMQRNLGGGIVVDYTPHGYAACPIAAAIESNGNRKAVAGLGQLHPLGQILASDFLECRLGIQGLYYDQQGEEFLVDQFEHDVGVIDTTVSIRGNVDQEQVGKNP